MPNLLLFHGDKGGVGKSFAASVYLDRELSSERSPLVVESDLRNPDVIRMYRAHLTCEKLDLSTHEGWMDLYDLMSENPESEIVVSMPSQIGNRIAKEAPGLHHACKTLNRHLIVVWTINRLADSVHLLKLALTDLEGMDKLLVVRNGFFGDENKFYRWEQSKLRKEILSEGHSESYMPELHERVVDRLAGEPMPFSVALQNAELRFSERAELEQWIVKAHAVFAPLNEA